MDKRQLRKEILSKRALMPSQIRKNAESHIYPVLFELDAFKKSHVISSFVSFRDEVEMDIINQKILKNKMTLVLPYIDMETKTMTFHIVNALEELKINNFGILEPNPKLHPQIDIDQIDLVLTPGVAFDLHGYRVGYGGGFYDRFFSEIKKAIPKVGIAFELQVVNTLEPEIHDLPVTHLITESGLRSFVK